MTERQVRVIASQRGNPFRCSASTNGALMIVRNPAKITGAITELASFSPAMAIETQANVTRTRTVLPPAASCEAKGDCRDGYDWNGPHLRCLQTVRIS